MGPERELEDKSSRTREEREERDGGMGPERLMLGRERDMTWEK